MLQWEKREKKKIQEKTICQMYIFPAKNLIKLAEKKKKRKQQNAS